MGGLTGARGDGSGGGDTVRAAVRDVVAEVAPEEIVLLDGLSGLDDDAVVRALRRRGGGRDPLGFGLAEISALVTPVVYLAVDDIARRAVDAGVGVGLGALRSVSRRVLRRPVASRTVPPLSVEQLEEVHRSVVRDAAAAGIESARAGALANAVVARLARGAARAERPPSPAGE